ncbi:hypothetical protein Tsubulata_003749 [Turnera subulata]|uniref:Ribosome biogenesis protein NOP53 n=1 Tax=Turnera subulata TaxID=218843 RepID=A0A9Q0G032_9ROSI|nr:hypothetical protein Tsubulata_003749 [Turnera subulata]
MGKKAKGSRKGKKAWRANISTADVEDFFEKSTKDALSGGSLSHLPTQSLVFVDKSKDLSVRRKIEKHREKVLRVDSVLQQNPFVEAVPSSNPKPLKKHKKLPPTQPGSSAITPKEGSSMVDIWDDPAATDDEAKKASKPSLIPAVEIEPPGCSYNPSFEAHQDSLAQAVAEELQKVYKDELGPQPVPLTVPGQLVSEEDMFFLEADTGNDVDDGDDDVDGEETMNSAQEKRSAKTKRVTRVELNKRARLKEQKKKEAEAKKKEELSKEIDALPDIIQEITKEDEEKEKRHVRRIVAKQERLKTRPPRLGKHKFEPAPVQVLLSEEITGSLRKIKVGSHVFV